MLTDARLNASLEDKRIFKVAPLLIGVCVCAQNTVNVKHVLSTKKEVPFFVMPASISYHASIHQPYMLLEFCILLMGSGDRLAVHIYSMLGPPSQSSSVGAFAVSFLGEWSIESVGNSVRRQSPYLDRT